MPSNSFWFSLAALKLAGLVLVVAGACLDSFAVAGPGLIMCALAAAGFAGGCLWIMAAQSGPGRPEGRQ